MSDSQKRIKPASVAAFLFMPQFRLSFQHFSFIVPVFIRTIAVMFEQAGLLPPNHPATRYGMEGVKRYKFTELIGEAFYTLRSTAATPYQWSLFAAVVMMIVFTILSAVTTLLNLSGMLVGTASAQIFDHPSGSPTDIASIPAAAAPGMFNKAIPATGGHADYGIMILDKMLREGAMGLAGPGGSLQRAVGSLMQIYNTGVLVIAGIMLFWIILTVVVDTAKTGTIGGGRHNMVWAPIRIVFALGLLIPLGASGFSSGQFMVMKLAEWGSNFGTRAWLGYVSGVVSDASLIAAYGLTTPTEAVAGYTQMWVCRVAYNGNANAASPTGVNADQRIQQVVAAGEPGDGNAKISFTNATGENLCGSVTFPTPANNPALAEALLDSDVVTKAIAAYKVGMMNAYAGLFVDTGTHANAGTLGPLARELACAFVAQHIYGLTNPLSIESCGVNQCGSITPAAGIEGQYPDPSCVTGMIGHFNTTMQAASATGLATLTSITTSPSFLNEINARGWAGMGVWYHRIEQMNTSVADLQLPPLVITTGTIPGSGGTQHGEKLQEIFSQYQNWWQNLSTQAGAAAGALAPADAARTSQNSGNNVAVFSSDAGMGILESARTANPITFINALIGATFPKAGVFVLDLLDPQDADTYPMAQLAKIGGILQMMSISIFGSIGLLGIVGAGFGDSLAAKLTVGWVFNAASATMAFLTGPVTSLLTTAAGLMMMASLTLKYYIPLLPFLRVAHAVLTWMISVFEAVVMVPIAALAHLTTEGEGIAGGARNVWILWLNVLLRPVLTVTGFIAAMIIFNTFVVYFHAVFARAMLTGFSGNDGPGPFGMIVYVIIYVFVMYTSANSIFKLLDLMPSAMMRWMGGSADQSFDEDSSGAMGSVGSIMQSAMGGIGKGRGLDPTKAKPKPAVGGEPPQDPSRRNPQGL